jgi:hypothetical protein
VLHLGGTKKTDGIKRAAMKVTNSEIKQKTYRTKQSNIMKEECLFSFQLLQGKMARF